VLDSAIVLKESVDQNKLGALVSVYPLTTTKPHKQLEKTHSDGFDPPGMVRKGLIMYCFKISSI
jgi:hypothetical protein